MSKKILVVDDEADVRTFLSTVLKKHGYEVIMAHNGGEGLELAKKEKPDLITLDLMMPKQSGTDMYRKLQIPRRAIIMTGDVVATGVTAGNGLQVILSEDHATPVVHVEIWYHVGSKDERKGRTGFAHLFEHIMFEGSAHVPEGDFDNLLEGVGGTNNGSTNTDRTNYFETLPVNQLEIALWLEADRMGFLLEAVTQEKFEVQRETVKNERGQRVDNQPYGRAFETLSKALYEQDHPYYWPVIGWLEDLNRADVNDLKRFFLRWYGPNNAALTIGGDIDPIATLELVNKYFGGIPAGPDVRRHRARARPWRRPSRA